MLHDYQVKITEDACCVWKTQEYGHQVPPHVTLRRGEHDGLGKHKWIPFLRDTADVNQNLAI